VFCRKDGSPLHLDVVPKDVLYPILDRLGIERRRGESGFHAFRHCAGSFVHSETGNLKLAQTLLGHTNLTTTAGIYTHNLTEAEREASEALEKKFLDCSQFRNLEQKIGQLENEFQKP
jgi:integrase